MSFDINSFDFGQMILDRLQEVFGEFKEAAFKDMTKTSTDGPKRYIPGERTKVAFESLMSTKIFDVEIRNFKDRDQLDLSNSFVTLLMPDDNLPLPIYAADVDVHKEKYVHVITDLILLSKNPDYLNKYDEPVKQLKNKYKDLPGMVLKTPDEIYKVFPIMKQFDAFASSGKIFGNIPIEHGPRIMELIKDYLNLYCSFAKESADSEILKRDTIKKEVAEGKSNFKKMMAQMDFSDDMPNRPKQE